MQVFDKIPIRRRVCRSAETTGRMLSLSQKISVAARRMDSRSDFVPVSSLNVLKNSSGPIRPSSNSRCKPWSNSAEATSSRASFAAAAIWANTRSSSK